MVVQVMRASTENVPTAALDQELSAALGQIFLEHQPIIGWSARSVYGYEALARSRVPGLAEPERLFEAATALGRIGELGQRIRSLCALSLPAAPEASTLFVNLHSHELLDEALYDRASALASWAPRVVLEITERAAIDNVHDVRERVARLRQMGYRIAVDDIGAGYSGLKSFAILQPDLVKLDLSLIRNVDADPMRRRLVSLVIELCRDLGIGVVAEGVGTAAERDTLLEVGVDLFQGFLFARPQSGFVAPELPSPRASL